VLSSTRPDRALLTWRPGAGGPIPLGVGGRVVSVALDLLVVAQECPLGAGCPHRLVNTGTRRAVRLSVGPGQRPLSEPVLSQDGLWIAMVVEPDVADSRPETALAYGALIGRGEDLTVVAGTRDRPPPGAGLTSSVVPPAWSLDGRVFGYLAARGELFAYQPGDIAARRVAVPGLGGVTRIVAA
jgi:hypothetical protein